MSHFIGEMYGGGIVYFINPDGKSGLVRSERIFSCNWYDGMQVAKDYSIILDGIQFNDWRLPSEEEFRKMRVMGEAIPENIYWTSKEISPDTAIGIERRFGDVEAPVKGYVLGVILVRSFSDAGVIPPAPPPVIAPGLTFFRAHPDTINEGDISTLRFEVFRATKLKINGAEVGSTAVEVRPTVDTTYTLVASNAGGETVMSCVVKVIPKTVPATVIVPAITSFTADKPTVPIGGEVVLTWQTENAVRVTINGVAYAAQGSVKSVPSETTTYTLVAISGTGHTIQAKTQVVVQGGILEQPKDETKPVDITQPATPATDNTLYWIIGAGVVIWILRR